MRRRAGPHRALRGRAYAAGAQPQMVEPAGLGHEYRPATRPGARPRRRRAQARRDPAPHVERRNRVPLRQGTGARGGMNDTRGRSRNTIFARRVTQIVPVGTMGKAISLRVQSLRARARKVVKQIETPRLPDPIMRRPCADREEKRVTRGNETEDRKEQLDLNDPNQRGLSGLKLQARRPHGGLVGGDDLPHTPPRRAPSPQLKVGDAQHRRRPCNDGRHSSATDQSPAAYSMPPRRPLRGELV